MVRAAWESEVAGPRLFIAIPTPRGSTVSIAWAVAFAGLLRRCPSYFISTNTAPTVDMARNLLVEQLLQVKTCEWILWLDTDILPPSDAYEKLAASNLPIVSALYRRRDPALASQQFWPVVAGKFTKTVVEGHETLGVQSLFEYNPGEVLQVDAVGMGCVLMHRKVFETLDPPWFNYTMRYRWRKGAEWERENWLSEDWYLFKKAKDAGFQVFLNTTVECIHQTTVNIRGDGKLESEGLVLK